METSTMGRVTTEATIENLGDLYNANLFQTPSLTGCPETQRHES